MKSANGPIAWIVHAGNGKYQRGIYDNLESAEAMACCEGDSIQPLYAAPVAARAMTDAEAIALMTRADEEGGEVESMEAAMILVVRAVEKHYGIAPKEQA